MKIFCPLICFLSVVLHLQGQDLSAGITGTMDVSLNEFPMVLRNEPGADYRWENAAFADTVKTVMEEGILANAFPGAQLLVAHQGRVVFHGTYGFHTYDSLQPVQRQDLYDLASVTKISAALPAIMKLYDQGKISLDDPFSSYYTDWKHRKDKKDLTLREILAHQAGLQPYIVYLSEVIKNGKLRKRWVSDHPHGKYVVQLNDSMFLNKRFHLRMKRIAKRSQVEPIRKYKYSGLTFLLYPELVSKLSGVSFDQFLQREIYQPIGAEYLMFNPSGKYPEQSIIPTEVDTLFRGGLVHSWVHDENASLMGGISGNAGLFGTAEDLGKLMQLYLQKGRYGDRQIFSPEVLEEFTRVQYPENGNRRGLGFDKPLLDNAGKSLKEAYPAPSASPSSFGHAGFTGTFVWVDPEFDLVYVFLSNRVYPNRSHTAVYDLKIRERLLEACYQWLSEQRSFQEARLKP